MPLSVILDFVSFIDSTFSFFPTFLVIGLTSIGFTLVANTATVPAINATDKKKVNTVVCLNFMMDTILSFVKLLLNP
ncbi:hypothetical protein D3C81_2050820 [compost metagenome]